jgi:hypothetical protein
MCHYHRDGVEVPAEHDGAPRRLQRLAPDAEGHIEVVLKPGARGVVGIVEGAVHIDQHKRAVVRQHCAPLGVQLLQKR